MNVPAFLNGYPVLKHKEHAACATVFVSAGCDYVVATWFPHNGNSWSWGHYFLKCDVVSANECYVEVAQRNANRS